MDGQSVNQSNTIHNHNDKILSSHGKRDEEKQYPPLRVVLPAMAAIYLALFLVAIVSLIGP